MGGPSLRERVPSPKCPFDPKTQRELFVAFQEGLGAGIHFVSALLEATRADEANG
jgi:hypothetical protein